MNRLSELLTQPLPAETTAVQQRCIVTYHLSLLGAPSIVNSCSPTGASLEDRNITLLESRSLISQSGTTGFRTWEAALHLGQFLCSRPSLIKDKHVLELGAGTGYLSILCAKFLDASQVIASDGSDDVVNHLADNFFLNGLQNSRVIFPMDLKWGHALVGTEEGEWNGGRSIDVVLGADIIYDNVAVPALVATLKELAIMAPPTTILISAPQRNVASFETFLLRCQAVGFQTEFEDFEIIPAKEQTGPFYSDQTPIRICKLSYPAEKPGNSGERLL
jgi:protein-lysine N-methyltransferase EEF2KMT